MDRNSSKSNLMTKAVLLAAGLATLVAAPAHADEVSHTVPFTAGPNGDALVFMPTFDTQGDTRRLSSVFIRVNAQYTSTVSFENTTEDVVPQWRVELAGLLGFETFGAAGQQVFNSTLATGTDLAASDGVTGSGADFVDLGTLAATASVTALATSLEPFTRDALVDVQINTSPAIGVFPSSVLFDANIVDPQVQGEVTIVYEFVENDCFADFDGSGALDAFDFLSFQTAFAADDMSADCDGNGSLDLFDFLCFQSAFIAGCE